MSGLICYVIISDIYGLTTPFNDKSNVNTREGLILAYTLILALYVPIIYGWIAYKVYPGYKTIPQN